MPRFAANLTMLYGEHGFLDRFAAARADGFRAVEYMFPYPYPKDALAEALERNGQEQVLFNLPAGDWDAGDRGIACDPARAGEFRDGVGRAVEYAAALRCQRVNCLVGIPPEGADPEGVLRAVLGNLAFAARELGNAGVQLLVEPVNRFDIPGFWLHRADQAIEVMDEAGSPNIFLKDRIAHVQVADNPGRAEPGTGEINYPFLFAGLDREGYGGWIGCEYRPRAGTSAGLGWAAGWLENDRA